MQNMSAQTIKRLFVASSVMLILSLAMSVINVANVFSAPLQTTISVPNQVGFEGFLTDGSGQPLADGQYNLTFRVYSVGTGGTALYTETQAITVTAGLYSAAIGAVTTLPNNLFDGSRWIGVQVGAGSEITPRTKIGSVPFALNAEHANSAESVTWSNVSGKPALIGMIALFPATTCPSGWSEVTQTRGRVVVGNVAGATPISNTVGTAFTTSGQTRTITDVPAHTHSINSLTTSSSGSHTHGTTSTYGFWEGQTGGAYGFASGTAYYTNDNPNTGSAGAHTHTVSGNTASTGLASVDVTMPYIQLLYCKLN